MAVSLFISLEYSSTSGSISWLLWHAAVAGWFAEFEYSPSSKNKKGVYNITSLHKTCLHRGSVLISGGNQVPNCMIKSPKCQWWRWTSVHPEPQAPDTKQENMSAFVLLSSFENLMLLMFSFILICGAGCGRGPSTFYPLVILWNLVGLTKEKSIKCIYLFKRRTGNSVWTSVGVHSSISPGY